MHAGRIVVAPCKHMMHEVTVNPSVPVLKRMDVDKAEGKHCSGDHCIQLLRRPAIECGHSVNQ